MTMQLKAIALKVIEHYFPVVLFIMLYMYKVVKLFESVDEIFKCVCAIQMNLDNGKNVPVMLFIKLHKVVLSFESVDEIVKCGH